MRKYRNGKQSREPRRLSKYSPEYIQYRENRGGYSVKVGLCDITGDGEEDTISVAWRNPANGKVQTCAKGYVQSTPPAPSGISALASPQSAPSGISAEIPVLPGPTGISVTASPAAPGVPTVQELISSPTITHEGNTYTLEDDSSTLNISWDSGSNLVTRQDDSGENVITFSTGSLSNTFGFGPEITIPKIHANAHYVGIDLKEGVNGSDYIIQRSGEIFNNGAATNKPFYLYMHTNNLIESSTTRSKTILRLTYKTITNQILDTKYYKIGFEEL